MTRLVGADIDLTSTGYLAIRWCGLTHFVRLTAAEHDVFAALERVRVEAQATLTAKSEGAKCGIANRQEKAKAKAASAR